MSKIIYYASTANMGETSESDADKYRVWAQEELQRKFPDFEIEITDKNSTMSFWTDIDDIQTRDQIGEAVHGLWDYCPWDWIEEKEE